MTVHRTLAFLFVLAMALSGCGPAPPQYRATGKMNCNSGCPAAQLYENAIEVRSISGDQRITNGVATIDHAAVKQAMMDSLRLNSLLAENGRTPVYGLDLDIQFVKNDKGFTNLTIRYTLTRLSDGEARDFIELKTRANAVQFNSPDKDYLTPNSVKANMQMYVFHLLKETAPRSTDSGS